MQHKYIPGSENISHIRIHSEHKGLGISLTKKQKKINYGFSTGQIWELDHKEGWVPKNLCFGIVWLEKTFENPLDCREIKPGNLKGNQYWILFGRTDTEGEAAILWQPDAKNRLIGKILDARKDWRQKEKGTAEAKMVRQHPSLDVHDLSKIWEIMEDQGAWHATVHGIAKRHEFAT